MFDYQQKTSLRATVMAVGLSLFVSACGLFGGDGDRQPFETGPTQIGVNGYLWQASLDTLEFMPLSQSDPGAGLILTDWYTAPDNVDERVKVTVRFLTDALRSDAVKVTVVRQRRETGTWVNAPVQASTSLQIEEAILTQARRLRIEREG